MNLPMIEPGVWHELYHEASHADSLLRRGIFMHTFEVMSRVLELPGELAVGEDARQLLRWTWDFHDKHLASTLTWQACEEKYFGGSGECNQFCNDGETEEPTVAPIAAMGPGMWAVIHIEAACVDSALGAVLFAHHMHERALRFPCGVCKSHFDNFMAVYPPEEAGATALETLHWTHKFHNNVNERLGKAQFSWTQTRGIYGHLMPSS